MERIIQGIDLGEVVPPDWQISLYIYKYDVFFVVLTLFVVGGS